MRLIDADVMVDIIRKSNESHATNSREEVLLERNARLIEEQAKYHPVNIEPRPHGEWINKDYGIGKCWATCSECGESTNGEAQDSGFGYDYSFPKFCPNCGADMREEGDRNEISN